MRSWLPFAAEGVPTQTNESSVSRIASAASSVTDTRPEFDHVAHELLDALLEDRRLAVADQVELDRVDVDTDHRWPSRARQASDTAPT